MADWFLNKRCDEALCRLSEGDMNGLSDIYDLLSRRIFMLSLSILRDEETARDAMQDTFLKLATESQKYEKGSRAVAFILTVARNISLNILDKRRREAAKIGELDEGLLVSDTDTYPSVCTVAVLSALSVLDDDERQIVVMKLDANMKHKAIAKLLGISEAAAQKRYRRAIEKLKKYYKEGAKNEL